MDSFSTPTFIPRQSEEVFTLSEFKELAEQELNKYSKLFTMKVSQDYKNRQIKQVTGNLIESLLSCLTQEEAIQIVSEKFKVLFGITPSFDSNLKEHIEA